MSAPEVMILIPEISRSLRFDVLISQYPRIFSSRSMAVSFFKATVRISSRKMFIQDAFRLALSHVEIVIQCLLSKLLRKFSTTIVFEALDDVVHCAVRHILCAELRFHNDLRLSMQSSPMQPWSQSVTIYQFELNLREPYISFPLSCLFVDSAIKNCGTCSSSLRSVAPDFAEDLSSATSVK